MTATTEECLYYATIELPDGVHQGIWDCREVVDVYLGHVDFSGKTVLEVGPANGYFTFEMERRGGILTCLDLGQEGRWDLVPGPRIDHAALEPAARLTLARIEAAFWHGHAATGSQARMVYGSVYDAPELVEKSQIGILSNVLQHLRDPIGGLMALADRTTETIIVTESMWIDDPVMESHAVMQLIPRAHLPEISQSWFQVSMPLVGEALAMLGFENLRCEFHWPEFHDKGSTRRVKHMTWVGQRP